MTSSNRVVSWLLVPPALLLAGLALAACGSSSNSATGTTSTTSTTTAGIGGRFQSAAFKKYTACLSAHGVTLPAFGGGRPGTSTTPGRPGGGFAGQSAAERAKFEAARTACAKDLPAGSGGFFGRGSQSGASSQAFAAYRNCLKLHGVTLRFGPGTRPAAPTAKQRAAETACAALRPARGGFGGAPPSTTTAPTTTTSTS